MSNLPSGQSFSLFLPSFLDGEVKPKLDLYSDFITIFFLLNFNPTIRIYTNAEKLHNKT